MLGRFPMIPALAAAIFMSVNALQAQGMPRNITAETASGGRSSGGRRSGWTNASYRRAAAKKRRVKAARQAKLRAAR
jgi:hypothetical protein